MPVIHIQVPDFRALYGEEIARDELLAQLPLLGGDLDKEDGDDVHIEFFQDRPDLVSVEGIARALRAFNGLEPGRKLYEVAAADGELTVDPAVGPIRPYILACHVRGLPPMDDDAIKRLMDFQEKLGFGIGRRRERVAIGIHDAGDIQGPYRYTTAPGTYRFHPLQADAEMSASEVMTTHPKGIEFGRLLPDGGPFPIIEDARGTLLSLPPVINGQHTALKPGTTDLLLDLTGPDPFALEVTMAILVTAFADRGGTIHPIRVAYPEGEAFGRWSGTAQVAPNLEPTMHAVRASEVNRILGFGLERSQIIECLRKMGHDASPCGKDADEVHVYSPRWRGDLLHEVDLIEDVAKGFGYDNVESQPSLKVTFGRAHPAMKRARLVREALVGKGYLEVTTLTISNDHDEYVRWGSEVPTGAAGPVRVTNPITEDHTILRVWLLPSLFRILDANRHRDYPQSLFEVGQVVSPEHEHGNRWHAAALHADTKAGFTKVKSLVESMLVDLAIEDATLVEDDHPGFIPGRVARLVSSEGQVLARFGEVHPRVLDAYEIRVPVMAMEWDLDAALPAELFESAQVRAH